MPTLTINGHTLPLKEHVAKSGNVCHVLAKREQNTGQAMRFGAPHGPLAPSLADVTEVVFTDDQGVVEIIPATYDGDKLSAAKQVKVNGEYRNFTLSIRDKGEGWNTVAKAIPAGGGASNRAYDNDF